MRHCYVCNRCGVPITNALCEQCHGKNKKKKVKMEIAEHFLALAFISGMTLYFMFFVTPSA